VLVVVLLLVIILEAVVVVVVVVEAVPLELRFKLLGTAPGLTALKGISPAAPLALLLAWPRATLTWLLTLLKPLPSGKLTLLSKN